MKSQTYSVTGVPGLPANGLWVDSFENGVEKDPWGNEIAVGFIYDQAVAAISYLVMNDVQSAEGIFATLRVLQLEQLDPEKAPPDEGINHAGSW